MIKAKRKLGCLAVCTVYLSSPKLYWSVEKGRKSGQARVSQHLMALHPALLPSQGHLTSVSVCLTLARNEHQLGWVGQTPNPVGWLQSIGWGWGRENRDQSNGKDLYHVLFQEFSLSSVPTECLKYPSTS